MAASRRRRRSRQSITLPPQASGGGGGEGKDKDFRLWLGRVQSARRRRSDWERAYKVDDLAKTFLGRKEFDPESRIVNKFEATIETILPNVFLRAPKFFVRPKQGRRNPVDDRKAAVGEATLEAIGEQDQNFKRAVRLALQQMFFRMGVLKVVYDLRLVPNPRAGEPIFDPRPRVGEDGEPRHVPLVDPKNGRPLVEPDEILDDNTYRYEWVDARCMLLPDEGPDQAKWPWIAQEIQVPIENAKEDPVFAGVKDKIKPNHRLDDDSGGGTVRPRLNEDDAKDSEMFMYVEIWDMQGRTRKILVENQDFKDFVVDDPLPEGIEDHPYALLAPKPITDPEPQAWPKPMTFSWLDLQIEYNIRRNQIMEGAKGSARKIYYDDNTFPDADEAFKALGSNRDMEAVKVNDVARPPVQAQDAPLNSSILQDIPLLNGDWQMQTGTTPSELFGVGGEAETAFEAGLIQRQADARDAMLADQVNDWMATAGRKMLQLATKTMTIGMWVRMREFKEPEIAAFAQQIHGITPDQLEAFPAIKESLKRQFSQTRFRRVTRSELIFDAEVSVVPGSSRPINTSQERRILLELIRIFGAFPAILTVPELTKRVLKAFDMEDDVLAEQLQLAARKLVEINARQAGRDQGGSGDQNVTGNAIASALMNAGGGLQ